MKAWHVRVAARVLRAGGVIAYPTEAVFGLGCAPHLKDAVARIRAVKRRNPRKGLIIVAACIEQVRHFIDVSAIELDPVLATWPGPVTWILPAGRAAPPWITGSHRTIAIRVSAHPVVRELCESAGPMVSTSANPPGCPPARSLARVRAYFPMGLDYLLPGQVGGAVTPSEIRDAVSGLILRKGG